MTDMTNCTVDNTLLFKEGDYILRSDFTDVQWKLLEDEWDNGQKWYSSIKRCFNSIARHNFKGLCLYKGVLSSTNIDGNVVFHKISPDKLIVPVDELDKLIADLSVAIQQDWGKVGTAIQELRPPVTVSIKVSDEGIKLDTLAAEMEELHSTLALWKFHAEEVLHDFMDKGFIIKAPQEPPHTTLWMSDTSGEMLGALAGSITRNKLYENKGWDEECITIKTDIGVDKVLHHSWFKQVKNYDEDSSELVWSGIEFEEGDYIDLRKHTLEQIRDIEELSGIESHCDISCYMVKDSDFHILRWKGNCFSVYREPRPSDKEYHYNDLFRSQKSYD